MFPRPTPSSSSSPAAFAALAALLLLGLAAGCAQSPHLVNVWQDPGHDGPPLDSALVVGVRETAGQQRIFENEFAARLERRGVAAEPAHEVFPDLERPDRIRFLTTVREHGFDAVFISRIVGVDVHGAYTPGYAEAEPALVYRDDVYGFYDYAFGVHAMPGYLQTYEVVTVETNVYETRAGTLVWSGQTRAVDPSTLDDEVGALAGLVIDELAQRELIAP